MEIYLMTGDAARILKRSEMSVRIYSDTGKLPCVKTVNGRRLYRESDVRRLAAELSTDGGDFKPAA